MQRTGLCICANTYASVHESVCNLREYCRGWRIMNMRNRKIQYSAAIFHFQAIIGLFNWTINWIVRRNAHVAPPYLRSNWINVVQDYLGKRRSILAFVGRMRVSGTCEYFEVLDIQFKSDCDVAKSNNFEPLLI